MPTIRLTQAAVDKVAAPKTGRVEFFDRHLPSFGLRVGQTGHKSWVVLYRIDRKQRRYTFSLVSYPNVDLAREHARKILHDAERGIDHALVKAALPVKRADTVADVATDFIARWARPRNKSWEETEKTLQRHVVSRWGARDAASIIRRDILDLLDELVDRGNPITANRVLAAVRKMFNWAVERDILATSPVVNITAPGRETERERVLTDEEITKLWAAADKAGGVGGAFVKVLLLTGQRRAEAASMRWADLDLESRVWTLPRTSTKADRSHEVPLAPLAIDVITALPRTGEYVFTTTRGERPISGYSKIKARIETLAGFTDWRIHDLRRTAGTGMARLGIAVSTISRVLNHKEGGVTKIYNRYSYFDEKKRALEMWSRKVDGLVTQQASNVVPLLAAQ